MGRITKTSKLRDFVGRGNLRHELEDKLDEETLQYLIDIVCRAIDKPWRKNRRGTK